MVKLISLFCLAIFVLLPQQASAGKPDPTALLLPRPVSIVRHKGFCKGNIDDAIVKLVSGERLGTYDYPVPGFPNEGYELKVTKSGFIIAAASRVGVIRARQTLEQLKTKKGIPCCEVTDYPAFKVRGFMHDVGRSYISFNELEKELRLLSRFKINLFHWHLTDHQGFRFESKRHPELNHKGITRFPGKYYTQAECRRLDSLAFALGIVVIPEVDMPGHSTAFEVATGCSMASAEGKAILKEVLTELAACFPHAPYIHIGGDETGMATANYIKEMADYVHTLGKKAVCWNRYGSGKLVTPKTMAVDMLTNWATSGTLVKGLPNIDMRYYYANHFDVFADLAGIFRSSIFGVSRGNKDVAGVSIGFWNDRRLSDEKQILAQNNFYAVMAAIAERAWVGAESHQYIEQSGAYLPMAGAELEEFKDWEDRFLYYKGKLLKDEPVPYVRQSDIVWNISKAYPSNKVLTDSLTAETTARGAGLWLNHIWSPTVVGVLGAQSPGQTRYAWTYVYSRRRQVVGAQIEFFNYSRSDWGQAPQNGEWDNMGSRVWINDEEILPTWAWDNAGQNIGRNGMETDLGNLNFPARKPLQVKLRKGWNKVLLKLPYITYPTQNRPNKWQFTFVFTTPDGRHAAKGLVYSSVLR